MIAGRYELGAEVGSGNHGSVREARDRLTKQRVAVKFFRPGAAPLLRGEIAILRALDLPGVVHFVDDGEDERGPFLVTDFVQGMHFPGPPTSNWADLAERIAGVAESLGRLHAAGVLHRDIKPGNVMVRDDGSVVLLDLGVALDLDARELGPLYAGTPYYMAPEVLAREPVTELSDVYSLCAMIAETIAGKPIFDANTELALRAQKDRVPDWTDAIQVPAAVRAFVRSGLDPSPARRPRSALELVEVLSASHENDAIAGLLAVSGPNLIPAELEDMFHGPDIVLHLREDAAAALHTRTGGARAAVRAEIARWIRAGVARRVGDRLEISRADLDRLLDPHVVVGGTSGTLRLRAPQTPDGVADLLSGAHAARHAGRPARAAVLADAAIIAASVTGGPGLQRAAARELALAAVESQSAVAAGAALHRLRFVTPEAPIDGFDALLRGARVMHLGDVPSRLSDAIEAIPHFADLELDRARHLVVTAISKLIGDAEYAQAGADAMSWALDTGEPALAGAVSGWVGHLHYARGDYETCVALNMEAATTADRPTSRLSAMLNAAAALVDLYRFGEAELLLRRALRIAGGLRHALFEFRAHRLLRHIGYHRGDFRPMPELSEAADRIDVPLERAPFYLIEAAMCWRQGRLDAGAQLAERAVIEWTRIGRAPASLATGLLAACGGDVTPEAAREALALSRGHSDWFPQVAALLAIAGKLDEPVCCEPTSLSCWDVLSARECAEVLARRAQEGHPGS